MIGSCLHTSILDKFSLGQIIMWKTPIKVVKLNVICTRENIRFFPVLELAYFVKLTFLFRSDRLSKTYAESQRPIATTFSTPRPQGHFRFTILTLTGVFSLLWRGRGRPGNINARLPPTPEMCTPPFTVILKSRDRKMHCHIANAVR